MFEFVADSKSVQFFPPFEKNQKAAGKIGYNEWTRVDIPANVVTFGDLDKWMVWLGQLLLGTEFIVGLWDHDQYYWS